MGLYDFTIYDIICRNAQIYSDRDAIFFNQIYLSYREFKEKCDQFASGLVKLSIKKGDRIAVVANNSDEYLILLGAAAKIGAIVILVNFRLQKDEVKYVFRDCSPKMVFAGQDYQKMVVEASVSIKSIKGHYSIGGGGVENKFLPFEVIYSKDGVENIIDIPTETEFVIIPTAAVGGKPRGAVLSQANIIALNVQLMDQYNISSDDCHLCFAPIYHIAGLSWIIAVMHKGGKNVLVDRFDAELTLQLIEREKVTMFLSFSPILKKITDKYPQHFYDISSVRKVGGLDTPEDIERFLKIAPNAKWFSAYGQTEAMAVTWCTMEEKPGSVGRPSILTKIALFDDNGNEVPIGIPGEICVRSPMVFQGYWGMDDENAYTFRNNWHHTGDIGRFDKEGYLWYVKRKTQKELIKPGGENVYPAEVEKIILSHKGVSEVCVIGVTDSEWGEAIKAICVIKEGMTLDSGELIDFVASKIARYKKPKYVTFVDSMPKTKEGEIDRDQVKRDHGGKY